MSTFPRFASDTLEKQLKDLFAEQMRMREKQQVFLGMSDVHLPVPSALRQWPADVSCTAAAELLLNRSRQVQRLPRQEREKESNKVNVPLVGCHSVQLTTCVVAGSA